MENKIELVHGGRTYPARIKKEQNGYITIVMGDVISYCSNKTNEQAAVVELLKQDWIFKNMEVR